MEKPDSEPLVPSPHSVQNVEQTGQTEGVLSGVSPPVRPEDILLPPHGSASVTLEKLDSEPLVASPHSVQKVEQTGQTEGVLSDVSPPVRPEDILLPPHESASVTLEKPDSEPLVASPHSVQNVEQTGQTEGALSGASPPVQPEDILLPPHVVQQKVKAALNKITPGKFQKISDQILDIVNQSRFETDALTLRQVVQLTFEKAIEEAVQCSMYAKLCQVLMESMDPSIKDESTIDPKTGNTIAGGMLFRKYLVNRCQVACEHFHLITEGLTDEAVIKRRVLGLIQFIGELFKHCMLTERIMHEVIKKLINYEGIPLEYEIESLCVLFRTIGSTLDISAKSRPAMEAYFARIKLMIELPRIPSYSKAMLMVRYTIPFL